MNTLTQLHADIEARVRAIQEDNPEWLCRLGCDGCCRRLAEVPRLTAGEWNLRIYFKSQGIPTSNLHYLRFLNNQVRQRRKFELPGNPVVNVIIKTHV